jgi:hypothetical protein
MPVGVLADEHRGTGRTTRQLERCRDGSLFVWCTQDLSAVIRLCMRIGGKFHHVESIWTKPDGSVVRIARSSVLTDLAEADKYRGYEFTGLTVDHAFQGSQYECGELLRSRVRKPLDTKQDQG